MRDGDIDTLSADSAQAFGGKREAERLHHIGYAHAPAPHPYEYRGTRTCDQCGCRWQMNDLSAPNPIDDLCREPVKWHPKKCLCHSEPYVTGLLDERARIDEEVVGQI